MNDDIEKLKDIFEKFPAFTVEDFKFCLDVFKQRDEYALLLFQPKGAKHHNATECPYCKEYLNTEMISTDKWWHDLTYSDKQRVIIRSEQLFKEDHSNDKR